MAKSKKQIYTTVSQGGDIEKIVVEKVKKENNGWSIPPEYLNLGVYLAVPLVLAVIVGQILDKRFATEGIFTIILILFGTISVFYNLYKLYKQG